MTTLPMHQTTTSISGPIPPIERGLADLVASYRNRIETVNGQAVLRGGLPTAEHTRSMRVRFDATGRALRPVRMNDQDKRTAGSAIASMLTAWIYSGKGDPRDTIAGYITHLSDMPLFAIEDACRKVAKGYVDGLSPDFPPSAARLHQLAMDACAELKKEMADLHEVLTAKAHHEPTDEERSRIAIGFKRLAEDLIENDQSSRKSSREESAKQIDEANRRLFERECAVAGTPNSFVSPSLLKILDGTA
jgi:hypothetical protein